MAAMDDILKSVENKFGLVSLHDYQKKVFGYLMDRENVFVCQRTGKGKSLCFQGYTGMPRKSDQHRSCHLPTYT